MAEEIAAQLTSMLSDKISTKHLPYLQNLIGNGGTSGADFFRFRCCLTVTCSQGTAPNPKGQTRNYACKKKTGKNKSCNCSALATGTTSAGLQSNSANAAEGQRVSPAKPENDNTLLETTDECKKSRSLELTLVTLWNNCWKIARSGPQVWILRMR